MYTSFCRNACGVSGCLGIVLLYRLGVMTLVYLLRVFKACLANAPGVQGLPCCGCGSARLALRMHRECKVYLAVAAGVSGLPCGCTGSARFTLLRLRECKACLARTFHHKVALHSTALYLLPIIDNPPVSTMLTLALHPTMPHLLPCNKHHY